MSLTYDYDYTRQLVNKLQKYDNDDNYLDDMKDDGMDGGSVVLRYNKGGKKADKLTLDMKSQMLYDTGKYTKLEAMMKSKTPVKPSVGGYMSRDLVNELVDKLEGGSSSLTFSQVKNKVTPILKKALTAGLDIGAAPLGAAVASALGGPEMAPIGAMVGKVAREMIKTQTGYGLSQCGCELSKKIKQSCMKGGSSKFNYAKIKQITVPILKKAISKGLDIGAPALGGIVAEQLGGNKEVGRMVGKIARELVKELSGYGSKDVGIYTGGNFY